MTTFRTSALAVSSGAGKALSAATRLVAVRPAGKPLHPRGSVVGGTLRRFGGETTGAAWLDEAGEDRVLVRRSRAIGLPAPAPDIFGVAIRVLLDEDGPGDLLFASTGLGKLTRYTLTPAFTADGRPMTTLMPYRTPSGPLLLSATAQDADNLALSWAVGAGSWHTFAELVLDADPSDESDQPLSFDPIRNQLPGLEIYDWVRRLREPAYLTARRTRA
jgi:hypothetical protein